MAEPEIVIVLTDDWELRGNGLGDVETLQVRPATRLMNLYDQLGIKSTFNAEVMQQLAFEAYVGRYPNIAKQRDLWIEAVRSMRRCGFDVQLHIHPQWYRAEYDGQAWKLDRRWHIVDYSRDEIRDMVSRAVEYLSKLIAPAKIRAFRSGAWGMGPPSREILEALSTHGITLDMSLVQGSRYDGDGIRLDYTALECPYKAYSPNFDDIRKIGRNGCGFVTIPTQSVPVSAVSKLRLTSLRRSIEELRRRFSRVRPEPSASVIIRDPFGFVSGRGRHDYILDLSNSHSRRGFRILSDICIDRALNVQERAFQVLVFTNHTKDLQQDCQFGRIEATIRHIRCKYPQIAFMTMSQVAERTCALL